MKNKLFTDKTYINLLHDYNDLKDVAFQLVEVVANITQCATTDIFKEFDVRDVEQDKK